jgi:hypothetical protein
MYCEKARRRIAIALLVPLSFGLLSCTQISDKSATAQNPSVSPAVNNPSVTQSFQTLPLTLRAVINQQSFKLAVASTPQQQQMGLMFRTVLPDDEGMLFPFMPARRVGFWMKNTLIPLDMLYIRGGVIREIQHNVPPCKADPCPTYPSKGEIDQVIELRGGRAQELNIRVGDRVELSPMTPK